MSLPVYPVLRVRLLTWSRTLPPYNLGRLDQYLYPYYKADKAAGILTDDDAQELLDCLWIKVAEMSLFQDEVTAQYAAGYCITVQTSCGGIDQYGNDATNELSYMMIQATEDVKFKEPNLSVTYSISKNPDSLLHKAVECIGMGLTMRRCTPTMWVSA